MPESVGDSEPERPDAEMTPRDTMCEFLVKVDSITSWVAHRHRLPADEERDLLAVSTEARRRYEEIKHGRNQPL